MKPDVRETLHPGYLCTGQKIGISAMAAKIPLFCRGDPCGRPILIKTGGRKARPTITRVLLITSSDFKFLSGAKPGYKISAALTNL